MARAREFNGKVYTYSATYDAKKGADRAAEYHRDKGRLARVTGSWRTGYKVWIKERR